MPNWKKLVTSGSNASLNSLTVSNGITGSLFGTASWAANAITASYALNAVSASFAATASYATNAQNTSDILVYVKNLSGAQINKGRVVKITGAVGDNPLIVTASYFSENDSANTLGITYENIANDSFGYVITEGTLFGIDTDTFTEGQLIYLGDTGSIIGTAPIAPLHAVRLGQVLRSQLNNGSAYIRIDNGFEIGELHDVKDTTTTGSYGDLLVKSGSIWINSKQLTGSYGLTGSLQATSFTGSLFGTSSWANNAVTASYVLNAVSASFATTASFAVSSSRAVSSSFALTASFVSLAQTASYVLNAVSASFALNAVSSSYPITVNGTTLRSVSPSGGAGGSTVGSIFFGENAGDTATNANNSNFFGNLAGITATDANNSNFLGDRAGFEAVSANNSNFLGYFAGYGASNANNSNFLGKNTGADSANAANSIFIGQNAGLSDNVDNTSNGLSSILIGSFTNTGGNSNSILLGSGVSGTPIANTKANQFMLADTITDVRWSGIEYTLPASQAASAGDVLSNDSTGVLSWVTPTAPSPFPFTGSAVITGSLTVTGSVRVTAGITGSLFGTASWAANAITASYVLNAVSASFATTASYAANAFVLPSLTAGSVLFSNGTTIAQNNAGFFWDNANNRLGIGTTTPDYPLTVGDINVGGVGANLGIILNSVINAIPTSSVKSVIASTNSGFGYAAGSLLIQPRTGVNAVTVFTTEGTEKMRITHDGNVLIGTTTDVASSILTLDSTTKGILIPRMTTVQKNAIGSPATGLQVYDTTTNSLQFYNGTSWQSVSGGGSAFPFTGSALITGSLTVTGSLSVTSGITGSLFGTSSFALNAISSSYPITVTGSTLRSVSPAGGVGGNTTDSVFFGNQAGLNAQFASSSNFLGNNAGNDAGYANNSTFIGKNAGQGASFANNSTFIGQGAGEYATDSSYSTYIGHYAGAVGLENTNAGRNNIVIGNNIVLAPGRIDSINIGAMIFGTGSYFNLSTQTQNAVTNGRIGILQPLPIYTLDVSGSGRYTNGLTVTGSAYGNVSAITVSSNTASFDIRSANFFTVTMATSSVTHFNVTNPSPGQTVSILVRTNTASTASFSSNVRQVTGSLYTPSVSGSNDILTFVAFDSTNVFMTSLKRLV